MSLARIVPSRSTLALSRWVTQPTPSTLFSSTSSDNTQMVVKRRWISESIEKIYQTDSYIKLAEYAMRHNERLSIVWANPFDRPPWKLTLEEITFLLAPKDSGPVQDVDSALQSLEYLRGDTNIHIRNLFHSHLIQKLSIYKCDISTWLAFRNALISTEWSQIRNIIRNANVPDHQWPSFVLSHALPFISTTSELNDGIALFKARYTTMRFNRARTCLDMIAEIALMHLSAVHLVPVIMEMFFNLVNLDTFRGEKGPLTIYRLTNKLAKLLTRHSDQRARQAAVQLLEWADQYDESLQQHLCGVFLGYSRRSPVAATTRQPIEPVRKTLNSTVFLDVPLTKRILKSVNHTQKSRALRSAILCAGRHHNYALASKWFDEIDNVRNFDLYVYMVAMARANQSDESWNAFFKIQDVLEALPPIDPSGKRRRKISLLTWEAFLNILSRSKKVPVARVFSVLAIHSGADNEDLVKASVTLANKYCFHPASYTIVMNGLFSRGEVDACLEVWRAMLLRGMHPTVQTLTKLVSCLFALGHPKVAMEKVRTWCHEGVMMPCASHSITEPLVLPEAKTDTDLLDPPPLLSSSSTVETGEPKKVLIAPDVILGSVLLQGLYETGSVETAYNLWMEFDKMFGVAADGRVLFILLKHAFDKLVPKPEEAQAIFTGLLFRQHPELKECSAADALGWSELWLGRLYSRKQSCGSLKLPVCQIAFTEELFDIYIKLCMFAVPCKPTDRLEHVVLALVWMRALNMTPLRSTVALVCDEVNCQMPPLSTVRFGSINWTDAAKEREELRENAGVLSKWLAESQWPTNAEMRKASWIRREGRINGDM